MASLGQMVAGVAHEMNTPLGYIKNNVQMSHDIFKQLRQILNSYRRLMDMLGQGEFDEHQFNNQVNLIDQLSEGYRDEKDFASMHELYKDTVFGVDQISELVLNLKNFSRLDQSKVADVSLNECIDSALVIGRNNIKEKARIIKEFQGLPMFKGSPSQINQVFLNLVNNAAQAIDHDRGVIKIKTYQEENFVCATVQDNGKGIADDNLNKIFDPFFTTKPIGDGTGLGLSISYKIIQEHGGKINVVSKPGVGTKFLIAIPHQVQMKKVS